MFVDTNVLVYALAEGAPYRDTARSALARYGASGEALCISRQIVREFLAVITRPRSWARAQRAADGVAVAQALMRDFDVLEDGPSVRDRMAALCRDFPFGGRQVHDANIVATTLAHGEQRLLTFSSANFQRFGSVITIESLP